MDNNKEIHIMAKQPNKPKPPKSEMPPVSPEKPSPFQPNPQDPFKVEPQVETPVDVKPQVPVLHPNTTNAPLPPAPLTPLPEPMLPHSIITESNDVKYTGGKKPYASMSKKEKEAYDAMSGKEKAAYDNSTTYTGPRIPDSLKGETIVVNRAGFFKLYNALLTNKAGYYLGAAAKKILREVLGAKDDVEVEAMHQYIRNIHSPYPINPNDPRHPSHPDYTAPKPAVPKQNK